MVGDVAAYLSGACGWYCF